MTATAMPTWIDAREIAPPRDGSRFIATGSVCAWADADWLDFAKLLRWNHRGEYWEDANTLLPMLCDRSGHVVIHWWIEEPNLPSHEEKQNPDDE